MQRYDLLDTIRGFLILNMLLYHAVWDIVFVFGVHFAWYNALPGKIWQNFICCGFILLSGVCRHIGTSPLKHLKNGLTVFLCGLLITSATILIMPRDAHIYFGILTFMGSAMLLIIPLEKVLNKISPLIGAAAAFALFVLLRGIGGGSIVFGKIALPQFLYKGMFMTYLGFKMPGFYSADYFPLIPWLFLYLCGYFISPLIIKKDNKLLYKKVRPLSFAGRHSLIIYMLHQPLVYGVIYTLFVVLSNI